MIFFRKSNILFSYIFSTHKDTLPFIIIKYINHQIWIFMVLTGQRGYVAKTSQWNIHFGTRSPSSSRPDTIIWGPLPSASRGLTFHQVSPAESIPSLGGRGREGNGWQKMSLWVLGAVLEGRSTTHEAATLSAPLKVPYLLICISKQAADNFKVSTPMRPDTGMELCLSMCAGMCVCIYQPVCVLGLIS